MLINTPITIYNKYYNRETGLDEWHRTVVNAANWQGESKVSIGDKGLNTADVITIYIPMNSDFEGKTYIGPKSFENLTPEQVVNYFTFTPDDKVVKGKIDFKVTGIRPNTIAGLEERFDDVLNIVSVTIWDQGSVAMRHYKIGAN